MLKEYYIPYIIFFIINMKLLDLLKFNNYIAKLTKGTIVVLAIFTMAVGGYFLSLRYNITAEYNIHNWVIIFVATLLMNIGIKLGLALNNILRK